MVNVIIIAILVVILACAVRKVYKASKSGG